MGFRVKNLHPSDPPDSFPDPATAGIALGAPDGLLEIGGDLSPERLLAAYRAGLFPWFNDDQPILWWSPHPRAVLFPEHFHMSRSLARTLRNDAWEYSLNQSFETVIQGCADERGKYGTWLIPDMIAAYCRMHELGYAHSVECWRDGRIAGGIYGIRLGKIFFGESMYSARESGSKVALSALVHICIESGVRLIDCQVESRHLHTLGMQEIDRAEFLKILHECVPGEAPMQDWKLEKRDAAPLAALRHQA